MKTLYEIKEEVAKALGHNGWGRMMLIMDGYVGEVTVDMVAKRYAIEVAKQALEDAAENARMCEDGISITISK